MPAPREARVTICYSFCPSPRSVKAPDEIIAVGPQGGQACKAPLPSPFKTKDSRSSKGWWVGAEKAGTLSPREGLGTITCPSPTPKDPESSREGLWAPTSQPRAQSSLTSLGESWALVWGQSGTEILEKGQDTQPSMAMPHNTSAPAGTEATW